MTTTKTSALIAAAIGLGLFAGCASRTTTVREREITREPRMVEERTVVVPQPTQREDTTVIRQERRVVEED